MDSNLKCHLYNKKHITKKKSFSKNKNKSIEKLIHKNFIHKYKYMPSHYNLFVANNIIFNDRTHIVSRFKEFLIIDDEGEFLKRYYRKKESVARLQKYFKFYFLYSKVFPNYTSINENKFIYNNIHQKQEMIDLQEEIENEKNIKNMEIEIKEGNIKDNKDVFSTEIIDSLLNTTNKEVAEILFNINKEDLTEEETKFKDGVNIIVDKISSYQNKRKNSFSKKEFFIHLNSINGKNNINYGNKQMSLKTIKTNNNNNNNKENISQNLNNNYFISKIIKNSIKKKITSKNKVKENKTNSIIKRSSYKEKKSKNNSKNKKINDQLLFKKYEKDLFKIKKRFMNHKKNISQIMSTSIQSKNDFLIYKKNSSLFNLNEKFPSVSISNFNLISNPSSQVISAKISPSNSMKKQMKKQINKSKVLTGNKEKKNNQKLILNVNNDKEKEKYSRNKQLQTSSTTSNLVNNIIYYLNNKYKDSRNKIYKNKSINTINKINEISFINATKKIINNKIQRNNSNSRKIFENDSKNNKEYDIKYKLKKKIKSYKNNCSINFENNNKTYIKLINEKKLKYSRLNSQKSNKVNSTNNIFINAYKKLKIKKLQTNNINNKNGFCYSSRNLGVNDISKSKIIISGYQSKQNSASRSKNVSRDNIYKKNIVFKLNYNKKKGLYDVKSKSFLKKSFSKKEQ